MESIIQREPYKNYCFICGKPASEKHHVEGKSNRSKAEKQGMFISLCPDCHNSSSNSVHMNGKMKMLSHAMGQYAWMFNKIADMYDLPFGDIREECINAYRKEYGISYI